MYTDITENYLENLIGDFETEFLKKKREFALKNEIPILLKQSACLLDVLCRIKSPKNILEIGTAIGYSGSVMLNASPNSKLTTIELDEQTFEQAKQNFAIQGFENRVSCLNGNAIDVLSQISETFDFVFLDGAKSQYLPLLPMLKERMNLNAILIADNVMFKGYISGELPYRRKHNTIIRNMREFLTIINSDTSFKSSVLAIGDGMSISVRIS